MYEWILKRMKEKIRTREYIATLHAEEEKDADELSIFDIEGCVLSGEITERQRDDNTKEWKYRIKGKGVSGRKLEVIAKMGPTGKLIIITVYLAG
jgi:hypothetical protein